MRKTKINKIFKFFSLCFLILISIKLRLYKVENPIADWHSWRQADTASVTRHFVKEKINLFQPIYDDLSNIPSGKDNPRGYRFVEFPVYNLLHTYVYKTLNIFKSSTIEYSGRITSILLSCGTLIFIYLIASDLEGFGVGFVSALFFALMPFSIYYGRTILPESLLIFSGTASVCLYLKWISTEQKPINFFYLFFASFLAAIAFLIKPFVGIYFLPLFWYCLFSKKINSKFFGLATSLFIAIIPFVLWRWWMTRFPEGIPDSRWLFNSNNIRFKGAFFYWIFAERIGKLFFGYWGLVFLFLGLVLKKPQTVFYLVWFFGSLFYLFLIATGNVTHDYYQVILLPLFSCLAGRGFFFLWSENEKVYSLLARVFSIVALLFSLAFSWYFVRDYFNVNRWEMVEAGKKAKEILPQNAKVIAPYGGDTSLLYQLERQGWPEVTSSIEDLIQKGATHLVSINFSGSTLEAMEKYKILYKNERFVIIELTPKEK